MSFANRHLLTSPRLAIGAWAAAMAAVGWIALEYAPVRGATESVARDLAFRPESAAMPAWPVRAQPVTNWSAFQGPDAHVADKGVLSGRFRLAGTSILVDRDGSDSKRKAILDDLTAGGQHIVGEGGTIEDVRVVAVFRERVTLRAADGREEELWLSYSRHGGPSAAGGASGAAEADSGAKPAGAEADSPYGLTRVGENRWVFDRTQLLGYYQTLLDNPERLVQVYDTMEPVYDERRRITGYQVRIRGEPEFFKAAGLEPGDVVRSVNSIPMTNKGRAEYFIKQFANDEGNAFVLDLERDGQVRKLIYQIR